MPLYDPAGMSPEAKRWAVRLILESDLRSIYGEPHEASARALLEVFSELAERFPKRADLVRLFYRNRAWGPALELKTALAQTFDWLAARVPDPIIAPDVPLHVDHWEWCRGHNHGDCPGDAIARELLDAWEGLPGAVLATWEAKWGWWFSYHACPPWKSQVDDDWNAPNEDDWIMDDPNAPAAPKPLVVIRPSRPSAPAKRHPYANSRQFGQAARVLATTDPDRVRRRNLDELVSVFGRNPGAIISDRKHSTSAPAHRPHRGTRKPASAEERLLAECPGCRIEDLRRIAQARGKPSGATKELRGVLERAVSITRARHSATNEALAAALGCSVRTIHRLRDAGDVARAGEDEAAA